MRNVLMPGSLGELWDALDRSPRASVYAGGTDLLVRMRSGQVQPDALICLERIQALKGVCEDSDHIRIGSTSTHAALLASPEINERLPVLAQALQVLGSPLIRSMGTIGGNLCTASPAGDTLPPLYALKSSVELLSRTGVRSMPIEEFVTGPGVTQLENGEILTAIRVPKPHPNGLQHFEKVGLRNALACSVVSLAAVVRLASNGIVEEVSLAWGSVGPTVVRCPEAEARLRGKALVKESLQAAAALARRAVTPISDVRAGADYRRIVAGSLLLRLELLGAGRQARGGIRSGSA